MKKILLCLLGCSIMIGCGRQTFSPNWQDTETGYIQNTATSLVSIKSAQGLKQFYKMLVADVFNFVDFNEDHLVNFKEFMAFEFQVGNGNFGTIITNPSQPVPTPPAPIGSPMPTMARGGNFQDFYKVDKNGDGQITLKEAQANYLFLGVHPDTISKYVAEFAFNYVDTDNNRSVSKLEFQNYIAGLEPSLQHSFMALFFASDKNYDEKLGFYEYEDLVYDGIKAGWNMPSPGPIGTTPPCPPEICP